MWAQRWKLVQDWLAAHALARQTVLLWLIDSLTNVVDYGFHIFVGRVLMPGDFAVLQTLNSVLLILATICGVLQPVIARYVAEAKVDTDVQAARDEPQSIYQSFFWAGMALGLVLSVIVLVAASTVGRWLDVPAKAVSVVSTMFLLSLLRPIVGGMLQGDRRFVAFGFSRLSYALGRLLIGAFLVAFGAGLFGLLSALPLGASLSLLVGMMALDMSVGGPGADVDNALLRDAAKLSAKAVVGFGAYMLMMNLDLIWVNRSFPAEVAGAYAAAVLLRRVVALLPGALILVMYPRVVTQVKQGRAPDRLLLGTAGVVVLSGGALAVLYTVGGHWIARFTFGPDYQVVGPWLGGMALSMMGFSLGAIWLNIYLAIEPKWFVLALVFIAALQAGLLSRYPDTLSSVLIVFGITGWTMALVGLLLYLLQIRPQLMQEQ
jgi:O-antigen/teichoic acid export membrane protein